MWTALRALLADDNHTLLDEARALLEPEFDVVGEVGDGQALLEAAERLEPDVLVVDISMPVVNRGGPQARSRRVRSLDRLPGGSPGPGIWSKQPSEPGPPGIRPKNIGG